MKPKYKKPLYIIAWEEHPSMPRSCWLCKHWNRETAVCDLYNVTVPETFAASEDQCEDWVDENGIPF